MPDGRLIHYYEWPANAEPGAGAEGDAAADDRGDDPGGEDE
ncbi:MAG TPA: hypothetical protein VM344_10200 [Vitreimonas sp.]|nr:hypothetical protein [Vitreimonas sp.]